MKPTRFSPEAARAAARMVEEILEEVRTGQWPPWPPINKAMRAWRDGTDVACIVCQSPINEPCLGIDPGFVHEGRILSKRLEDFRATPEQVTEFRALCAKRLSGSKEK